MMPQKTIIKVITITSKEHYSTWYFQGTSLQSFCKLSVGDTPCRNHVEFSCIAYTLIFKVGELVFAVFTLKIKVLNLPKTRQNYIWTLTT